MSRMQDSQVMGTAKMVSKTGTVIVIVYCEFANRKKELVWFCDMSKIMVLDMVALKSHCPRLNPCQIPNVT